MTAVAYDVADALLQNQQLTLIARARVFLQADGRWKKLISKLCWRQ